MFSNDGKRIFFYSDRNKRLAIYVVPSDRNGSEELFFQSPTEDVAVNDMSSDGRFLMYVAITSKAGYDLMVLPLDEKGKPGKPFPFLATMFDERQSQFSPDGHWVVYESTESGGGYEVYVRPFPGPGGQFQISIGGGTQPQWSRNNKEIYYVARDGNLMAVPIEVKNGALVPGKPVTLFQTKLWGGGTLTTSGVQYAVTKDGRFLMNINADESMSTPITVLLNWKPPAK